MLRRHIALSAALILILSACSGDDSTVERAPADTAGESAAEPIEQSTTTTTAAPDPLARVVMSSEIDEETGELIEVEEIVGPTSYEELLEAGIEAGLWTELEGLELLLGHAVGAVPTEDVPGTSFLIRREFTHLLDLAHEYSLSDEYTADELAGIRRWHELAVPNAEAIEILAATAIDVTGEVQASSPVSGSVAGIETVFDPTRHARGSVSLNSTSSAQAACAPIDPEDFSSWAVVEGCYLMLTDSVQGVTVRVFYPAWYDDDDVNGGIPLGAFQAAIQSIDTFVSFGPVGDVDIIFSLVDTPESVGTSGLANDDHTWGEASRGGPCPITVFPTGFNSTFENTIAHEIWHCVQREMGFPRGVAPGTGWFREGGAAYFANTVFPDDDWFTTFDWKSTETSLFDMKYEAWVWWQFLASREGNREIAQLHKAMSDAGDGGQSAMAGRAEQFQRFVVELIAGEIQGPVDLPPTNYVNNPKTTVGEDDAGREVELITGGFTAARFWIGYDKELRVLESDTSPDDVDMAMVEWPRRYDPESWTEVLPEIRSKCKQRIWYVVAVTTDRAQSGVPASITIDEIEEASCDPCVLGTWQLDNAAMEAHIKATSQDEFPPGSDFTISGGALLVSFDEEGRMRTKRDGFTTTLTQGETTIDLVADSFATATYTANGERMTVSEWTEVYARANVAGIQTGNSLMGTTEMLNPWGDYECDDDVLTVILPDGSALPWHRVDAILEPEELEEG